MAEKLSRKEVELVLRRAAEIDLSGRPEQGAGDADDLDVSEVMRLGEEAGLRPGALSTALHELDRGTLREADPETRRGPELVVITRTVDLAPRLVRKALERFMRQQLMAVEHRDGDHVVWRRAQGIWHGLARSLDFARRHALGIASRVETEIREEGDGGSEVTIRVDLSEMRREQIATMSVRAMVAFAAVGLGGTAILPGFGAADVLALAAGSALAGGLVAVERRRYLELRRQAELGAARFLDELRNR